MYINKLYFNVLWHMVQECISQTCIYVGSNFKIKLHSWSTLISYNNFIIYICSYAISDLIVRLKLIWKHEWMMTIVLNTKNSYQNKIMNLNLEN